MSRLSRTIIESNCWIRKSLCNRLLIDYNVTIPPSESSLLDGLVRDTARSLYLRNWLICGPFTAYSGDLGYDYLTEDGGEGIITPSAFMQTDGKTWDKLYGGRDYVNFRTIYEPDNYDAVAYAYGVIDSVDIQSTTLHICSHDGAKVWLNGNLVYENNSDREYDYEDVVDITLDQGSNSLLVKVKAGSRVNDPDDGPIPKPWGFFARYKISVP